MIYCILRKVGNAAKSDSYWISSGFTALLFFDPQGAVIFQDDGVALVHGHEPVARVDGQHREPHTEIRRQDPVAAKALDFVVIRAGVEEMEHLVNSIANNRILT